MNKKASILMINLWILALLVIFALGLGHRALINLKLLRYQRDALKAYLFANAGINKTIMLLEQDKQSDSPTKDYDTIAKCGVIIPEDKEPKDIFSQNFGKESEGFSIGYNDTAGEFTYGMTDEERKILIEPAQKEKITALFQTLGILSEEDSNTLTGIIIEWISSEDESAKEQNLDKKVFKNQPLVVPEEMLLILEYFYIKKGSSKEDAEKQALEAYSKIKDFITLYTTPEGKININTVSEQVLRTLGLVAQSQLGEDVSSDINTLVNNILEFRKSDYFDKITLDAIKAKLEIPDDSKQLKIIEKWLSFLVVASDNFRIQCRGYVNKVVKNKTIVFSRKDTNGGILYCHQN